MTSVKHRTAALLLAALMAAAGAFAASALSAAARSYSVGPSFECIQAPCEEEPGPSGEAEFASAPSSDTGHA